MDKFVRECHGHVAKCHFCKKIITKGEYRFEARVPYWKWISRIHTGCVGSLPDASKHGDLGRIKAWMEAEDDAIAVALLMDAHELPEHATGAASSHLN